MKKVETVVAVHVGEPGDQKKLTEERKHGGNLEIDGGLLSILPHLPKTVHLMSKELDIYKTHIYIYIYIKKTSEEEQIPS